jgi:hypothetical protein
MIISKNLQHNARTGYPVLVPPNYPGNFTGGKMLLRLKYPVSEASLNTEEL